MTNPFGWTLAKILIQRDAGGHSQGHSELYAFLNCWHGANSSPLALTHLWKSTKFCCECQMSGDQDMDKESRR